MMSPHINSYEAVLENAIDDEFICTVKTNIFIKLLQSSFFTCIGTLEVR